MPTNFDIRELEQELTDFRKSLDRFDSERVRRHFLKTSASALAEMVREAIVAEDKITSPATNSKYTRGKGPSLAQRKAWMVKKTGRGYTVRPRPNVEQRAIVLNYGYPGKITPNSAEALKFEVDGEDVYAASVEGPDYTGYWSAAIRRFEKSGQQELIAKKTLREEALEKFR